MISSSPSLDLMHSEARECPLLDLLATMAKAFPTGCERQKQQSVQRGETGRNGSPGSSQMSIVHFRRGMRRRARPREPAPKRLTGQEVSFLVHEAQSD